MQLVSYRLYFTIIIGSICSLTYIFYAYYGITLPLSNIVNYIHMEISPTYAYTMAVRNNLNRLKSLEFPVNSSAVRPFLRMQPAYRLIPRYNLSICHISKSMCTLMQGIFCYLYDSDGFVANNRSIPSDMWIGRFCQDRNEVDDTEEKHLRAPSDPPTLIVVRNPVERFLSGFVHTCVVDNSTCYGCAGDLFCAVEGFHAEVMNVTAEYEDALLPMTSYVSLSHETRHFAPSNWHCDLYQEADNYIFIKYGESMEDLNKTFDELVEIFREHGVENHKIAYILNAVKTRTKHATKSTGLRDKYYLQLKSSPEHVKLLNDIYFYDNQIFGFDPL